MTDLIFLTFFHGIHGTQPLPRELSLEELAAFLAPETPPFVTREERKLKQLFSMNIYKEGTTRGKENVVFMTGVVFDFDNKDDYVSVGTVLNHVKDKRIAYAWYTTHSHTESRPKWRLVIPFASPLPVSEWLPVYQQCVLLIGNPPGIDHAACKDAAHMWFPPCKNGEQPYSADSDLEASFIEPLNIALYLTSEEQAYYQTLTQAPVQTAPVLPFPEQAATIKPKTPFTLKQALHLVSYLDAQCDYDLWVKVGKALHHQFDASHKAFKIWTAWSAQRERLDYKHDACAIRNLLHHRLRDVLFYLYPNGQEQGHHLIIGDVQGHAGQSMKIALDGDKAGLWHDFATGEGGDIFDLWGRVKGFNPRHDFPELLKDIGIWLGYSPASLSPSSSGDQDDKDLRTYWHHFNHDQEKSVDIGTLIRMAREQGYDPAREKADVFPDEDAYLPDVLDFIARDIPLPEMIVDPIIPEQGLVMLYAPRGIGKTYLSLSLAYIAAGGKTMLDGKWKASQENKVVFIDGEMPAGRLQYRVKGIIRSMGPLSKQGLLRIGTPDLQKTGIPDLSTVAGQKIIEKHLTDTKLLVLDNLSCLFRTGSENEAESWKCAQEWFLKLRRQGTSVLLIHHANKNGHQRGTSKKEDLLDTVIALRRPEDYDASDGARFEVHYEKARNFYGEAAEPFEVQLKEQDDRYFWVVKDILEDDDTREIMNLLADGKSQRDIASKLKISLGLVNKKVQAIKSGGKR